MLGRAYTLNLMFVNPTEIILYTSWNPCSPRYTILNTVKLVRFYLRLVPVILAAYDTVKNTQGYFNLKAILVIKLW